MEVGERIKKLRKQLKMTQYQLAKETGVQVTRLLRIENGKVKVRPSELPALAKALHVDSI